VKDIYYFIAIGGIGMSGLAKYLLEDGVEVLGSDISQNKNTIALEKMGAKIFIGHDAANLPQKAVVVSSTAIKEDNPELIKAKALGLEILHRSDLLARISEGLGGNKKKYFIGYSGTHGKTTTSGLSSYVLSKAGLEPAFVVGGIVPEVGVNSQSAKGDFFIAELDESDGTIVKYKPEISVINNLEVDHVDFYTDGMSAILDTFKTYLTRLPEGSKVLINSDCDGNLTLMKKNPQVEFITFALEDTNADYVAKNIKFEGREVSFDVFLKGEFLISLKLQVLGAHNVYNALAVLASLNEAGVNLNLVKEHFYTFTGMGRRFQLSAEFDGVSVYDDYAHHPTEIRAALSSTKAFQGKNIIAVFQPHRYSRLKGLWDDFLGAFSAADKVFITDVYAASEAPIEGVSAEIFTQQFNEKFNVPCQHLTGDMSEVARQLLPTLKENDVVIGLGAGTITALGKELSTLKEGAKK
jgi:UDP-N-acetylmuramate--alanine ligase